MKKFLVSLGAAALIVMPGVALADGSGDLPPEPDVILPSPSPAPLPTTGAEGDVLLWAIGGFSLGTLGGLLIVTRKFKDRDSA